MLTFASSASGGATRDGKALQIILARHSKWVETRWERGRENWQDSFLYGDMPTFLAKPCSMARGQ